MHTRAVIDSRSNALLLLGFLVLQGLQLALVPGVLLPQDAAWGWLLIVPVLLTNSWWAFIHEALHGHMFPNKATSRRLGRVNAMLFGAPFDLLRAGHLLHHAYSRSARERSEVYAPGRDSRVAVTVGYYFRLLGGLYLVEVLGGVLFLLPRAAIARLGARIAGPDNVVDELLRRLLVPGTLAALRLDVSATLAVYAAAFAWYAEHGWMLALALWARGLLISLVDNAFHYGTPLEDTRFARNLSLPRWAERSILNFNLHGVHHQRAALPWQALPGLHTEQGGRYQETWAGAILAQFRGPIPDSALAVHRGGAPTSGGPTTRS